MKYPNLFRFCQYFGPSWDSDFGDIAGAIRFFFDTSDAELQRGILPEIDRLLAEFADDRQLLLKLATMGCFYNPRYRGITQREWLREVQKQVSEKLQKNQPTKLIKTEKNNGIPGNTSDDRLRRQQHGPKISFRIPRRFRGSLVTLLVLAFFWEMGYQSTKRMYAGTGVEVTRFGGFLSMLRQLFGATPNRPNADGPSQAQNVRQPAPHLDKPRSGAGKTAKSSSQLSRAELVGHHKPGGPGEDEEFVFEIKLYKKDLWFDTGIPIAAGNYIWAYPPNEDSNAFVSAKIAGSIRDFRVKNNERPYPSLNLVIMSHEVEHEHVVLRNDEIEYLSLRLKENSEEYVRLFVRLSLINVNGALEETKQRQIALIERSSKRAGLSKAR